MENKRDLNIYIINDLHGSIVEADRFIGFSKIGKFLINEKEKNPDYTIILSAGDMFQGSLLSLKTDGKLILSLLNKTKLDVMGIGNHEFDNGFEYLNNLIKDAKFPFLAANICINNKNESLDSILPYYIIERMGLKIGVIATIGVKQLNDISYKVAIDLIFKNELNEIKKYTKILRTIEKCDLVILIRHSSDLDINQKVANLADEYKVDVIINGHTHKYFSGELLNGNLEVIPYLESGSNGHYIGKISLEINLEKKTIASVYATNLDTKKYCFENSDSINEIINHYIKTSGYTNKSLMILKEKIIKYDVLYNLTNAIKTMYDCDVGIINNGAIRDNQLPLNSGDLIDHEKLFMLMPFNNKCISFTLKGTYLKMLIDKNLDGLFFKFNTRYSLFIVEEEKYYKIVTIDYIFDKPYYPFDKASNIKYFNETLYDVALQLINENQD